MVRDIVKDTEKLQNKCKTVKNYRSNENKEVHKDKRATEE